MKENYLKYIERFKLLQQALTEMINKFLQPWKDLAKEGRNERSTTWDERAWFAWGLFCHANNPLKIDSPNCLTTRIQFVKQFSKHLLPTPGKSVSPHSLPVAAIEKKFDVSLCVLWYWVWEWSGRPNRECFEFFYSPFLILCSTIIHYACNINKVESRMVITGFFSS